MRVLIVPPFFSQAQLPSLVEMRLPVLPLYRRITFDTPLSDDLIPNLTILHVPSRVIHFFIKDRPVRELVVDSISVLDKSP
jgi:hypothetical protein